MSDFNQPIVVQRIDAAGRTTRDDHVAVEAPLEIQLQGRQIAVVMRTPGHDEELAVGFLVSEGVITGRAQIASLHHCSERDDDDTLRVLLADGVEVDFARLQRNVYTSSSCGVCGKASLEAALACAPPLPSGASFDSRLLLRSPDLLRQTQTLFATTGAVHGAAIIDADGTVLAAREDVGRHNAVDKLIGWATLQGRSLDTCFLVVSGRVSFEIVQKALAARLPLVTAVSAPTSLAIDLACRANMTIAGFVRSGSMNVYSAPERVRC